METGGSDSDDLLLLLQKLSTRLLGDDDIETLLDEVLDAAVQVTGADMGSMQLFDAGSGTLRLRAYRGLDEAVAASFGNIQPSTRTSCGRALAQGRRVIAEDVRTSDVFDEASRAAMLAAGVMAAQSTPLMSRADELLGMISTHWRSPHLPTARALQLMDVVARQAADLLERAQSDQALRMSSARLQLLTDAIVQPQSGQTFDSLMDVVRAAARQLSQADGVSIVLRDGGQYHYVDDKSTRPRWPGQAFPLLACVADWALRAGQTAVVRDVYADERIPANVCEPAFIKSLLMVPVGLPEPIAAVGAYWSYRHDADPEEVAILEALARATGTALHNVELLGSLRKELAERKRAEAALRDSEERLRRALQAGEVFAYEWNCADDVMIRSGNCAAILGADGEPADTTGRDWEAHVHPDDRGRFREAIAGLEHGGGRQAITYRYVRSDGGVMWLEENSVGERGPDGRLSRVSGLVRDVTARKRVEELQQLLMREFDHRARNMLATIQAMISLTARTYTSVNEFVTAVQSRIRSMARAHELIAGSRWTGAGLRELVEDELEPYVADRPGAATITGRDEVLTPGATMAVAMALHELATNAAKYGALSVSEGHVHLDFSRQPDGSLALMWRESGGPEVIPPRQRGFGSLLIEGSIRTEAGGAAEVRYLRSGLECAITIPAAQIVSRERPDRPSAARREDGEGVAGCGNILLVEDQALIALETKERLESFGYKVVGPAHTVEEAVRLANSEPLGAAILDINLGEKDVFPVVDILATRNIPIAFITGYKLLSLPPQYRDCPVLTKPLSVESIRGMFGLPGPGLGLAP